MKYIIAGIIIFVLVLGAFILFIVSTLNKNINTANQTTSTSSTKTNTQNTSTNTSQVPVRWSFNENKWVSNTSAPSCVNPLEFNAPVDVSLATSILYPGQVRGGDYKVHGGFRFDNNTDNKVTVTLPVDAYLIDASRYIEGSEIQYMLDFVSSCGIMFRFDHLAKVSNAIMAQIDSDIPPAQPDDSRTTNFNTQTLYKSGDVIATEVGHLSTKNIAFDFGVYDLRTQNYISLTNTTWAAEHANKKSQAYFGICWLNNLTQPSKSKVMELQQIGSEGNTSDFCSK